MTDLPHLSPIQYKHGPDGTFSGVYGAPGADNPILVHDPEPFFDWFKALGLPQYREQLEAWARPNGMAPWRLRFVIADEGPTHLAGGFGISRNGGCIKRRASCSRCRIPAW